jgi:hypothetical protein
MSDSKGRSGKEIKGSSAAKSRFGNANRKAARQGRKGKTERIALRRTGRDRNNAVPF